MSGRWMIACALILAAAASASAQQPVYVTGRDAKVVRGTLMDLGPETLSLLVDGQRIDMPLASVTRIEAPGDRVRNGAIIGAIIMSALCAASCAEGVDSGGEVAGLVVLNVFLGAALGAGIDAMHQGRTVIFERGAAAAPAAAGRSGHAPVAAAFRYRF
jgi:hypothetical protein